VLPKLKGFVKFFKDFKLFTLSLFISILSKLLQTFNLLSFFPPYTKINHSSPPNESCVNKYSQDLNQKLCPKEKASNDLNLSFKDNEKEGNERRS